MTIPKLDIPHDRLADFCRKWKIIEMSLFGSVLRDDFGPGSDVDVMVVYESGVHHGVDEYFEMIDELEAMFGREVDLVERPLLKNPFMRHRILTTKKTIYAA